MNPIGKHDKCTSLLAGLVDASRLHRKRQQCIEAATTPIDDTTTPIDDIEPVVEKRRRMRPQRRTRSQKQQDDDSDSDMSLGKIEPFLGKRRRKRAIEPDVGKRRRTRAQQQQDDDPKSDMTFVRADVSAEQLMAGYGVDAAEDLPMAKRARRGRRSAND